MTDPTTNTFALDPDLQLTVTESGTGRPALILHGGGGPFTVAPIAEHLAERMHVITPTHPGWNGTERPDRISNIDDLALVHLEYLDDNDLNDVLVVGSSLGGWIASEMALRDGDGLVTGLVLLDAVGVEVEGEPVRDFFALDAREVAEYTFHDSDRFYADPATLTPEQAVAQQANMATMRVYAGDPYMHDPKLLSSLGHVRIPTLAIWGESDRIVTPAYGAAYAAAFANAQFEVVPEAGHLPHLERPDATFALIDGYVNGQEQMNRANEQESRRTADRPRAPRQRRSTGKPPLFTTGPRPSERR